MGVSFAVVIPVYNRSELSLRAVRSVLAQEYADYELVVVDDGSTENQDQLRAEVEQAGGRFIRQNNLGVSAARNVGVASSRSEWIAFLDSDDEWEPAKLLVQSKHIASLLPSKIFHTNETWIRKGVRVNQKLSHAKAEGLAFKRCLELCCISPSSVVLQRELFESSGGFDERMRVCEDYDLWIRLSASNRIELLPDALVVKYGGHENQLSRSEPAMDRYRIFALFKNLLILDLREQQQRLLIEELVKKLEILEAGARKREDSGKLELYTELRSLARAKVPVTDSIQFFSRLERELLDRKSYE